MWWVEALVGGVGAGVGGQQCLGSGQHRVQADDGAGPVQLVHRAPELSSVLLTNRVFYQAMANPDNYHPKLEMSFK